MSDSRLEKLLEMLSKNPNDPFLLYGVALEFKKTSVIEADKAFSQLLEQHPHYLPTYYMAAEFYADKDLDKTSEIYQKGIDLAKSENELKALSELQQAFELFKFENDLD